MNGQNQHFDFAHAVRSVIRCRLWLARNYSIDFKQSKFLSTQYNLTNYYLHFKLFHLAPPNLPVLNFLQSETFFEAKEAWIVTDPWEPCLHARTALYLARYRLSVDRTTDALSPSCQMFGVRQFTATRVKQLRVISCNFTIEFYRIENIQFPLIVNLWLERPYKV